MKIGWVMTPGPVYARVVVTVPGGVSIKTVPGVSLTGGIVVVIGPVIGIRPVYNVVVVT